MASVRRKRHAFVAGLAQVRPWSGQHPPSVGSVQQPGPDPQHGGQGQWRQPPRCQRKEGQRGASATDRRQEQQQDSRRQPQTPVQRVILGEGRQAFFTAVLETDDSFGADAAAGAAKGFAEVKLSPGLFKQFTVRKGTAGNNAAQPATGSPMDARWPASTPTACRTC